MTTDAGTTEPTPTDRAEVLGDAEIGILKEFMTEKGWRNRTHKPIYLPPAHRIPANYLCWGCNEPWPCPTYRMAGEIQRLREELAEADAIIAARIHPNLRAAIEAMTDEDDHADTD